MLPAAPQSMTRTRVIVLASGLTGMMPMATDIYLVVMPSIAREFSASLAATHASMAMFAFGFGVAHLFIGVLADRYGRRPVAIGGGILFILATVALLQAPSLGVLTAFRFVQGLVIATCPILSRAIVRDTVPPAEAARAYSQINAIAGLAPLLAPFVGALAVSFGGWRMAMTVLLTYGAVLSAATFLLLSETRPAEAVTTLSPLSAARTVLTNPHFVFGSSIATLHYSALFTWLSTSPFLMIDELGFSPRDVAIVLGLGSFGFMMGSLLSARSAGKISPEGMIARGAPLMLLGALGALFALTRQSPHPLLALVLVFPFYLGLGLVHANTLQVVMRPFPHMAGQASAWLGLIQQTGGVLVSVAAVRAGAGHSAIVVMIAVCCCLVAVSRIGVRRR